MDGTMSIWHLLIALIILLLIIIPFWRVLPQAGIPVAVSRVSIVPFGALILMWSWPSSAGQASDEPADGTREKPA